MNYWLVKSEPEAYSYDDLVRDGSTYWDGVRNYAARNNLKAMKKGDTLLYYHSVKDRKIVGLARVIKEAYQDPTTDDDRWVAVDIEPIEAINPPIGLEQIKADDRLSGMALVRISRLSVQPVTEDEFGIIMSYRK